MQNKNIRLIYSLTFFLFIGSCATVPGTDRSQLMLISPGEEKQLGVREFEKMKATIPISNDNEKVQLVRNVGLRISKVAPLENADWEFVLFDQPKTPNAFCLPGGKVGIYTGILPITKNEAGLATVMGHEVAHAVARHGAERLSTALLLGVGGQVLDTILESQDSSNRKLIMGAYGIGSTVGVILPYSRNNELEADKLGLMYMARAGYDPREAVEFWQRFKKFKGGKEGVEFLSTHPLDDKRIAQLKKELPKAMKEYQKAIN